MRHVRVKAGVAVQALNPLMAQKVSYTFSFLIVLVLLLMILTVVIIMVVENTEMCFVCFVSQHKNRSLAHFMSV